MPTASIEQDRAGDDRALALRWLLLAVGSLILAGGLALALVVARTPGLDRLVSDPLLFKRILVIHVDLSLVVWFYAFIAGLFSLLPSKGARSPLARLGPWLSLAGMLTLVVAGAMPGAAPVLSNYIPMIDHPIFAVGLLLFGLGVAFAVADGRLLPGSELQDGAVPFPEAARPGLRAAALAFLVALLTFFAAWLVTPTFLPAEAYAEVVAWGGGHVLQVASVAAMLSVWLLLLESLLGAPPVSRPVAALLFGILVLPTLAAPVLALQGTLGATYRNAFTALMQWGIFPVVLCFLALSFRALLRARRAGQLSAATLRDPRFIGFAASAALTVLGFVLGAMIRGSNTMVPAHYHAAIGAVTASFMAVTHHLAPALGLAAPRPRLLRLAAWQPLIFGGGQAIFAIGFGLAGAHGMGRKMYGAEQAARALPETIGLGVMGLGGLVAIAGGLFFLFLVLDAYRRAPARHPGTGVSERSGQWARATESIPSRS